MRLGVSVTSVLFVATVLMIILDNSSTPIQALARLPVMTGNLTVSDNVEPTGNAIAGGFYSPTNQVSNKKDNDG